MFNNSFQLLKIDADKIILNNKLDLQQKILIRDHKIQADSFNFNLFKLFIEDIKDSLIRINHIGASYICKNLRKEIAEIKNGIRGSNFKLYEEKSWIKRQKWLFIGNLSYWDVSLFEIVVSERKSATQNFWQPHFQIDLDINLEYEELKKITERNFGKDFIKFKLDIPNYGVVFYIGRLGIIQGTKICLGIGTKKRITEWHRKRALKEIK